MEQVHPQLSQAIEPQAVLPEAVTLLLDGAVRWSTTRWRDAARSAYDVAHRARRADARALCEALLAVERRTWLTWLARDGVHTCVALSRTAGNAAPGHVMTEILEAAALALIARPELPLTELAVLLGPCLPLPAPRRG